MKLEQIREIREVQEGEVNKTLKEGFAIIKIVKLRNLEEEKLVYCVGRI